MTNTPPSIEDDVPIRNLLQVAILDSLLPDPFSGFRAAEFNYYMEKQNWKVYSTNSEFDTLYPSYIKIYPNTKEKIIKFNKDVKIQTDLMYIVFLDLAYHSLSYLEKNAIPFIFTLYPGGGFQLNNAEANAKLIRICESPVFRGVIVTQKISYDYLISQNFCNQEKIKLIYGGVLDSTLAKQIIRRPRLDQAIKICFVARKYEVGGVSKGFDTFVKLCSELKDIKNLSFHVVGDFTEEDIKEKSIPIKFYGVMTTQQLIEFYSEMDILISPNRPSKYIKGHFDGFPTGCAIEAGMSGVALICTDPLGCNTIFTPNEIIIVQDDLQEIKNRVLHLKDNLQELDEIAANGRNKMLSEFNIDKQIYDRISFFQSRT